MEGNLFGVYFCFFAMGSNYCRDSYLPKLLGISDFLGTGVECSGIDEGK